MRAEPDLVQPFTELQTGGSGDLGTTPGCAIINELCGLGEFSFLDVGGRR